MSNIKCYTGCMSKDQVLIEDLDSKFDAVIEMVGQMRDDVKSLAKQVDLEEIKSDVKVVKAAVTDISHTLHDHEARITNLETA